MEEKKTEQRTAQILYVSILLLLLIAAIAVGITGAANKRAKPIETAPATTYDAPAETKAPAATAKAPQNSVRTPAVTAEPGKIYVTLPTPAAVTTEPVEVAAPEVPEVPETPVLPTFILPTVGDVAKKFAADVLVYSKTLADYRTHDGVDIAAAAGEAVMAAADGEVIDVYVDPLMGYTVVLSHDGDAVTVYQNLSPEIPVEVGDSVHCGAILGTVGDTAMIEIAEEPHLHFAMQVGGVAVDPLDYIAEATMTVVYEDE